MINLIIILSSLLSAAIIIAMLFFTTPAGIGPLGILVFFVLIYVVMLGVATWLVRLYNLIVKKKHNMTSKDYATGGVLAFFPVMVLFFISIGVPNILVSVVSAVIFVAISVFLVRKII